MPSALFFIVSLAAVMAAAPLVTLDGTTILGGKAVPDAVVWLEASNAPRPARLAHAVLQQRNLQFAPHVIAVRLGTKVQFPNDDRVFHNVFSFHDGKPFDLGLYPVGMVKNVPFDVPGLSRVFCNIHPQMAAYVMVLDTPYFAVSDSSGRFAIQNVPSGNYAYHAWRAGAAIINGVVEVGPGKSLEVNWP